MLKTLQKELSIFTKKDDTMAQEELSAAVASVETLTAELSTANAALTEQASAFAEVTEQLTKLKADFAEMETALAAAKEAREQLEAANKTAKLTARKEKIVASIGTDKADALMTATEGLDDAAFESVVSALAGSVVAEAKTDLFVEKGVTAEADAVNVVAETAEMALIKKSLNVK